MQSLVGLCRKGQNFKREVDASLDEEKPLNNMIELTAKTWNHRKHVRRSTCSSFLPMGARYRSSLGCRHAQNHGGVAVWLIWAMSNVQRLQQEEQHVYVPTRTYTWVRAARVRLPLLLTSAQQRGNCRAVLLLAARKKSRLWKTQTGAMARVEKRKGTNVERFVCSTTVVRWWNSGV